MKKYRCYIGALLGIAIISGMIFLGFLWTGLFQNKEMAVLLETADLLEEEKELFLKREINSNSVLEEWNYGIIVGTTGENFYTEVLKNGSIYGNVEGFLTFEYSNREEGEGDAFVVAGRKSENGFSGSVWFVSESGRYLMLEQNVSFIDNKIEYQEVVGKRYIFLNFEKEGRNCGRVFLCDDTTPKEILGGIPGNKTVNADGNIVCRYFADDSRCKIEINLDTGEKDYIWEGYTEKPYLLQWYKDGKIREVQAETVTREELLSKPYGADLLRKTEEIFPNETKQYIVRENGEINVNIAKEGENMISFSYMTFWIEEEENGERNLQDKKESEQQSDKVFLVDQGAGCYLLHMTGEASWREFLNCFASKDWILPNEQLFLTWYPKSLSYHPFEEDEFEKEICWFNRNSVGKVFIPEGDLKERLSGFIFDYRENWEALPFWTEKVIGSEAEKELYHEVRLIGKTDSFLLYGTNNTDSMILETKDGTYLWIDYNYAPMHYIQPNIFEADFDQDGEAELVIQGLLGLYGSGCYTEPLFLADKTSEGIWEVYQLQREWYLSEMEKYYQTEFIDGWMNLKVNGELVGAAVKVQENKACNYQNGDIIYFQVQGDQIKLYSELAIHIEKEPINSGSGDGIYMEISYLGDGKWKNEDCSYYSVLLEDEVRFIVSDFEFIEEIKEIQYDAMLVRKCMATEESKIPVKVTVLTRRGEEQILFMELCYKTASGGESKEFRAEIVR